MICLDTSILTPLILPESASERVAASFHSLPPDDLAVSQWTVIEFASLVARKVRMGDLDAEGAARADAQLDTLLERSVAILLPDLGDYVAARRYLRRFESGLRAPDALHLAIASNRGVTAFYTLDKKLIAAANLFGLPVAEGI